MAEREVEVEFLQCANHPRFKALAVDGTRVTLKCCGSWTTVKSIRVSRDELLRALGIERVT